MDARETVRAYYEALRSGEPLGPFFAEDPADGDPIVKFGIGERLVGIADVRAGLRAQTQTTAEWAVDSRSLRVTDRGCHAWFSDDVVMEWTDTDRGRRHEFETRWSGTLESTDSAWRFVGMHVSTTDRV